MENITTVALDAMGGDNAPAEIVKGALAAVNERSDIRVIFVGIPEKIQACLDGVSYPADRVEIVAASEVIETAEPPVAAIRTKKDSSIVVALNLLKEGKADAFVSGGSTGAVLVGGTLIVGRIKGIARAPIATLIPTKAGVSLLVDSGANVDARSEHLVQFARMGSIYMQSVMGISSPKVGLVNIGAEEDKGNALVKETMPKLEKEEGLNFIGSVEARDIAKGGTDVIVAEGFVGNVILKMYEGVAGTLVDIIKDGLKSTFISKIGAALALPALKKTLKTFDASEYGGAPLLGLNGLVVKIHGSSKAKEVHNAILQCVTFKEQDVNGKIKAYVLEQNKED